MKVIPVPISESERNEYYDIWNKIYKDFNFEPSDKAYPKPWILLPMPHKKYRLNGVFAEEQEKIINSVFL